MMPLSITLRKQTGGSLILVVFILVVMASVAMVANQNQQRNSEQLISTLVGTRAEMAARSGAQIEISRFYQTTTEGSCHTFTPQIISFSGEGLAQCVTDVSCKFIGVLDNGINVYQLTSKGSCSVGSLVLQRIIEVGLRDDS
ncbi:MSHA biogenesis protein MshP [Vibrio lentus]|uniref:MSHA biogenesis protein MshP n=1 Tax=Vibrio lentus TaxID=136468 RepID=UPI000C81900C|nr:MSHA biogenesis protein MshP [Vibrio lentus]PMH29300.1 MSHA biogenesis protein MshP [Vibrio lentus]PMK67855.1 MSHA biogenesis protein MshP [Vibrio lentus]